MRLYSYSPFKPNGFSLIELMVVISIVTLVAAYSIPSILIFRIRAAQVEAKQNLNSIFTLVESYQADSGFYPNTGGYGYMEFGGVPSNDCEPDVFVNDLVNTIGFRTSTDCEKLRFYYSYAPSQLIFGPLTPAFGVTNPNGKHFNVRALSETADFGSSFIRYGKIPIPGTLCKRPTPYNFHYKDIWNITENRELRPGYSGSEIFDAAINCFQ